MPVYTVFQMDEGPHGDSAVVEAGSPEEAKQLVWDHLAAYIAENHELPYTFWGDSTDNLYPIEQWMATEAKGPVYFCMGPGCR